MPSAPFTVRRPNRSAATTARGGSTALLVLVACLAAMLTPPAEAQTSSQNELRRENARLRAALADRDAEVRALQARLLTLQEELARLEALVKTLEEAAAEAAPAADGGEGMDAAAPDGDATAAPPEVTTDESLVTIDESKPEASPRAIHAEALRRWEAGPGSLDRGTDAASAARTAFLRAADRWTREQNRTWSPRIDWITRIARPSRIEGGAEVWTLRAHDPVTDTPIGDPFEVRVRSSLASRVDRFVRDRDPMDLRFRLRGSVIVEFTIDPVRPAETAFGSPPLLAPFTTFRWGVDARLIEVEAATPAKPDPSDADDADTETGDADAGADDAEATKDQTGAPPETEGGG